MLAVMINLVNFVRTSGAHMIKNLIEIEAVGFIYRRIGVPGEKCGSHFLGVDLLFCGFSALWRARCAEAGLKLGRDPASGDDQVMIN